MPTPALYTNETVHSLRMFPSWILLAFSAGSVNSSAYLLCQRFVSHITGTITQIGMKLDDGWLLVESGSLIGGFVLGVMSSALLIDARFHAGRKPMYGLPLCLVCVILVAVGAVGQLGGFGPLGETPDGMPLLVLMTTLSFAMGMQNAAVSTMTNMAVRTTHLTGPVTDLGLHLAAVVSHSGETRRRAAAAAALRLSKIMAFVLGSVLMVPFTESMGYLALVIPALIIGIIALLHTTPDNSPSTEELNA